LYWTIARVHPAIGPRTDSLIESLIHPPSHGFVHANFSPKNILVHSRNITLVDFETAHAGDPAYDLGFFLSHLLLQSHLGRTRGSLHPRPHPRVLEGLQRANRSAGRGDYVRRAGAHASACALARSDGKSPVDYLDEPRREATRRFALAARRAEPAACDELVRLLARELRLFN
jgi:5-methylthioribose kinase